MSNKEYSHVLKFVRLPKIDEVWFHLCCGVIARMCLHETSERDVIRSVSTLYYRPGANVNHIVFPADQLSGVQGSLGCHHINLICDGSQLTGTRPFPSAGRFDGSKNPKIEDWILTLRGL